MGPISSSFQLLAASDRETSSDCPKVFMILWPEESPLRLELAGGDDLTLRFSMLGIQP